MKECIFKVHDSTLNRVAMIRDHVSGYAKKQIDQDNFCFTRGQVFVLITIMGNDIRFVKAHVETGYLDFEYDFIRKFFVLSAM
jgi:hypothetical protein